MGEADNVIFTKEAGQNVIKAAKLVLNGGKYGDADNVSATTGLQCITAKLLAQIDGNPVYTWHQERRTTAGWETVSNGLSDGGTYPAYDLNENNTTDLSAKPSTAHVVLARITVRDDNLHKIVPAWIIISGGGGDGDTFYVKLTKTSGTPGDKTHAATWKYTAKTRSDDVIATNCDPLWPRPLGMMDYATTGGVGTYDDDGTFVLLFAFEKPSIGSCT